MSTLKKLLCLGLVAASILSVLASCANNEDEKKPNESGTAGKDDSSTVTFVEADYKEEEFLILHYGDGATDFHDEYIYAEDYTGSTIGDAVYERNSLVEEKYNVKVNAEECGPMREATKRMQAGQCDFELIYEWGIRSKGAALDGMLYDAWELDNYFNFDQSYWFPVAVEGLIVADRMFVFTNMISMNAMAWADLRFFNKELMDKHV